MRGSKEILKELDQRACNLEEVCIGLRYYAIKDGNLINSFNGVICSIDDQIEEIEDQLNPFLIALQELKQLK